VPAPRDVLEAAAHEHAWEGLADHDAQDERVARARRRDALAADGAAKLVLDVNQIGKLGHAVSLAFGATPVQTAPMPIPAAVALTITVAGAVAFLANGIRQLRRRKRNLEHWEKGEPLEGVGDWD
jgi:hypothetical protein